MYDTIITNSLTIVNSLSTDRLNNVDSSDMEKWTLKKKAAKERAETFFKAGMYKRGYAVKNCGEVISGQVCAKCGKVHIQYAHLCRDRLCPICMWRLSLKRFSRMLELVNCIRREEVGVWYAYTLTGRNVTAGELPDMLNEMYRVWNNITTTKLFKETYDGWARSLEITYNEKTNTFHPHFHILTVGAGTNSNYLISRWLYSTRKTAVIKTNWQAQEHHRIRDSWEDPDNIDDALVQAVLEAYKYAVKDTDADGHSTIDTMPLKDFRCLAETLAGRRLVAFGGIIKYWAKQLEYTDDDMDDTTTDDEAENRAIKACKRCGSTELINAVAEWSNGAYKWRQIV